MSNLVFTYEDRIRITVSPQAQTLIGRARMTEFLKVLTSMLEALGVDRAWVGREGFAVVINMVLPDASVGWLNIQSRSER